MTLDLVPSADHHTDALTDLVGAFVNEVGYYFGRTRGEDGRPELPGITDVPIVNPNRHVIEENGQVVGFLDWCIEAEEDGHSLNAVYVSMGQRRRHHATRALRQLFREHQGTWSLTVSPRFGPGDTFARALIKRFGLPRTTSWRVFTRNDETYHRVTFSAGGEGVFLPPTGDRLDFEFDQEHHKRRRWVLAGAVLTPIVGGFLVLVLADSGSQGAAFFLQLLVWATTIVLVLVYLESVVTGILDRLDRGPILKPTWTRSEPKD